MSERSSTKAATLTLAVAGAVLLLASLPLIAGGAYLAWLGGSYYYAACGLALCASAIQLMRRRSSALLIFAIATLFTILWSLWEVGLHLWPLVPRLAPFIVMSVIMGLLAPLVNPRWRAAGYGAAGLSAIVAMLGIGLLFVPQGVISPGSGAERRAIAAPDQSRWQYYGRETNGTRFAPEAAITKDNVAGLDVAWTYRTGDAGTPGSEYQATPIQIADTLYLCTPLNRVIALDADTGKARWTYDPKVGNNQIWNRCRGVGYFESKLAPPNQPCHERIVVSTLDGRLIQVDARNGKVCGRFGKSGVVDLTSQMGAIPPTFYQPTSMPTVVNGLIILGGWVFDNISVDMPSGVVRAFDAETGKLVWAWDVGRVNGALPAGGETFTRSTPNMWSTPAVDTALGLIYLPTGNQTPDYWGAGRSKASERVSSSVVALDLATGKERWVFQTVHHDLWDWDVPAQPALYDLPNGKGGTTPVLIQATKRGQIFVLDRRTGKPVFPVKELPVPQEHVKPDWVSPTQPYSTGFASIGDEPLTEARMWGLTFYDQMLCRIMFRSMRYEGDFTVTTTKPTLLFPGNYGGMNWGSVSIDRGNDMLVVNDIRLPHAARLVPQKDVKGLQSGGHGAGLQPQGGAPYAVEGPDVNSVFGLPCIAPPWGTISGIDVKTGKLTWQRPAGTIRDVKIGGIRIGLPMPIGLPTVGGPLTTGSGLAFYAGTQDYYLRAMDSGTGKELWRGRLPVGAQATPMTYVSPKTRRQYVVIVAGGARESTDKGDYVVAFALPK